MNCKIDYIIYTDNKKEYEKCNVQAKYSLKKALQFEQNNIDIERQIYKRTTVDYELIIDFKKNLCELRYENLTAGQFKIESSLKVEQNKIELQYKIDKEQKRIVILLKEVIK